jgi:bacterioferritin
MLEEDLVAESIVIQAHQEVVRWLGSGDLTSRRLMERILEGEERHAARPRDLVTALPGGG